jgi:hypothetical protein
MSPPVKPILLRCCDCDVAEPIARVRADARHWKLQQKPADLTRLEVFLEKHAFHRLTVYQDVDGNRPVLKTPSPEQIRLIADALCTEFHIRLGGFNRKPQILAATQGAIQRAGL